VHTITMVMEREIERDEVRWWGTEIPHSLCTLLEDADIESESDTAIQLRTHNNI